MSIPKWKLLASPCPLRGSFRYARTGCWRLKGLIGHPYEGRTPGWLPRLWVCVNWALAPSWPDAAGVCDTSAIARAETRTAEATNGLQRLLMSAVTVCMPPPSSGPQTRRSRGANGSLTRARFWAQQRETVGCAPKPGVMPRHGRRRLAMGAAAVASLRARPRGDVALAEPT